MTARVVVVAGPSGVGKSVLCRRLRDARGWAVLNLDDFYREGGDPALPYVELPGGAPIVDWDDPAAWDDEAAVAALEELCATGHAVAPVYDIASDSRVGEHEVNLDGSELLVVEGIFADQVVAGCRERGLLADAVCVRNRRVVTFGRRLRRDLRERRKPPWVLVRRGLALLRAEPAVVARAEAAGCAVMTPAAAYARLTAL